MFVSTTIALLSLMPAQAKPPRFELKDGDRIVWIGNTLVEREQRYGYWETALHMAFPKANFTLRNLGWSGDTVWGEARGRFDFGNPDKCFRQIVDQTLELKPTVIFVSYGTNEAFEGEAGLAKFEKGLEKLLDALKPTNAQIVLFTPLPFEKTPTTPDVSSRNQVLGAYANEIRTVAARRGLLVADLFSSFSDLREKSPLTDNGVHLGDAGYKTTTPAFLRTLTQAPPLDWDRVESLRQAIIEKNQLFFHRWRPQNETYLFGFRKHEQGRNAKEVAEFDPLVAKVEEQIAERKKSLTK